MNWLYKLERKFGKFSIPDLMVYVTCTMLAVYIFDLLVPSVSIMSYMTLVPSLVLKGQVWRLITFIFLPPDSSLLFILFSLYFYYFIGRLLENEWGSFKFNIYYLFGVVGTIIASLFTGFGTNYYLNMSLFFAFATLFPNMEVLLFFFIPIKIKYLAYLDAAFFLVAFITGGWVSRGAIIASLINYIIFFGPQFLRTIKDQQKYAKVRRNFKRSMRRNTRY